MTFVSFFSQFISGISVGLVLFLIAAGLSLIFGTMRVLNLAHGTFFMVGSFLCFAFSCLFANSSGSFWWALLFAPIGVALIGGIVEVLLLRRIYNQDMLYQYILTFALILILGDGLKYFFGVSFKTIEVPWPLGGSVSFWGMSFPIYNIFLIVCGIAIFIFMLALMRYTKLGRIVRAVTLNRDMANALGINVPLVYTGVFMLGCYLAGLAGALMPPMSVVALGADMHVIIECFIIVVIGGLGSLSGAFIGAVILGFLNSFGILVMPKLAVAFPFMLMIFILIVRPHGLMGKPE